MPENKENHKHVSHSRVKGGLILILLGVLFLLATLDYISWEDWWAYFFLGFGVIFILEAIMRSTSASYRQHITGKLIGGLIFFIIGGSFILKVTEWWPLLLIAVGVILIISPLWSAKKPM